MKRKWLMGALIVLCIVCAIALPVGAKSVTYAPYLGYEYNDYSESVAAPVGYVPTAQLNSLSMGLEVPLDEPQDICCAGDGRVYILDSGNGRIVELNADFEAQNIYDSFTMEDGSEAKITGATGLAINSNGDFYVAIPTRYQVLKIDRSGRVLQCLTRPDEKLLDTDAPFMATKVTVDHRDQLYVIVESINKGAFVYTAEGEFLHFFGSNPVVSTMEVISDYFWKRFMTKEQRKGMTRITPTTFHNFDVDNYGFLYTVTAGTSGVAKEGAVRRLNYSGSDILSEGLIFGDQEWDRQYSIAAAHTALTDVDIDADGYINLLDTGRGRVFQYTENGQLIAEFGTYSDQVGGFGTPTAIESIGETVYVLDAGKNVVHVFNPSEYGATLRTGFQLLNTTDTKGALEVWTKAMKMNTNSQYAYYGIGMVYDAQGDYAAAMEQFKLAGAHEEYSKSLREYRKQIVNEQYIWLILGAAAIVAVVILCSKAIKKRMALVNGTAYSAMETKYLFPIYTLLHPADGFAQFKDRKIHSWRVSGVILLAWFFVKTISYFYTGYSFNMNRASDYHFLSTLFMSVGLFLLFVIANWSVCTLLNGKGTLKDIVATCAYSLIPYLLSVLINVALSNMLTTEESAIMTIISVIGLLWSGMLLLIGLQNIHQYGLAGTVFSVLLTIIGMAIICFLLLLFYTLVQQAVSFVESIYTELSLR